MGFLKSILVTALVAFFTHWIISSKKQDYKPGTDQTAISFIEDVSGMRIVITGASSGIGRELALKLSTMGAKILVTARTQSKLENVVSECKRNGAEEAYFVSADMFDLQSASLAIDTAMIKLGGIDMLVLNHIGETYFGGYRHDIEHLRSLFTPNMLTHAHMASLSLDSLLKNKGRIVVVSSAVAIVGSPLTIPYATTKYALSGFFRSLDMALMYNKTEQVTVSICYLGFIGTDTGLRFADRLKSTPADVGKCAEEIIRGSMAREKEIYFPYEVAWAPLIAAAFPDWMRNSVIQTYL